ncbi:MAG: CHASE domain-containing protein [Limisphaerales bacterium]
MHDATSNSRPSSRTGGSRFYPYLGAALAAGLGVALSLGTFLLLRENDRARAEAEFRRAVSHHVRLLQQARDNTELVLLAIRSVFHFSDEMQREPFRRIVDTLLEAHPGFSSLAWVPRVPASERAAFENAARRGGFAGFQFRERGADGRLVPAGPRPEYFPLYFVEPAKNRPTEMGLDLASNPAGLQALHEARDTGELLLTGRIRPLSAAADQVQFMIFDAVYRSVVQLGTVAQRRENLRGFVVGVCNLGELVEKAFEDLRNGGLDMLLIDRAAEPAERILHFHPAFVPSRKPHVPDEASFRTGLYQEVKLAIGGRPWSFLFRPAPEWLAAYRSRYPLGALLGGLAFTALLTVYLVAMIRRRDVIERLVAGRTADLLASNQQLEREIADRARAEAELRRSQLQLADAQQVAHIGSWEWDMAANVVRWSAELYGIFGLKPDEIRLTYEAFLERVLPEDRELVNRFIENASKEGQPFVFDCRITRLDGAVRHLQSHGKVIQDEAGKAVRMIGTAQDITDRKQAEAERRRIEQKMQETQKLESLGVLAGGIAHDFNNILTGVLGNAGLMRLDLPSYSPMVPFLDQIEAASLRAADLCTQMLAYSGKGQFHVTRLNLSTLVKETTHLLEISLSKKAILRLELDPNLPSVLADATQIRQITMNLVINASEAVSERGGQITLRTGVRHVDRAYLRRTALSPELPEGNYVFLAVGDDGCGMSAETQAKIFDPFFSTKFTGRGLGLAAVLGIVRAHNGAVKVESEPGRGSIFTLLLPETAGHAEEPRPGVTAGSAWRGQGTVMVVDDEEPVRAVAAHMMASFGFRVIAASDGREALAKFQAPGEPIRLVLLDLTMPQMDGEETFLALRRLRQDLPIVLMSGYAEEDVAGRFAGKGLAGFLSKPFKPETLREKIHTALAAAAG